MMTFEKLANRYRLDCELLAEESLHIGTGVPSANTDAPFITELNQPFLPGSSLRGAFRATVERIARTLGGELLCCTLFASDNPPDLCDAGNDTKRKEIEKLRGPALARQIDSLNLCPACELFGSTLKAAKLRITDARLMVEGPQELVVRDGVGIDRDTETARPQIKFDYEALDRGLSFRFAIELENAEYRDFALLYILLGELRRGIAVGGRRNRGLGRVRLQKYSVEYFDADYPLVQYLSQPGELTSEQFEKRLAGDFELALLEK